MKKLFFAAVICLINFAVCMADAYESVPNDPMKSRIYTLDNGLKIYLTDNKDLPRIQTYIAVRVGGKNDPAETTGLSHYLEHLMFKGTKQYGTSDYSKEKPYLDKIEKLYEVYRKTKDAAKRKAIYHEIDSLSYLSSKHAIANEYDKLMATIGAEGTNAYTSEDVTCYTEDIPANEVENWAKSKAIASRIWWSVVFTPNSKLSMRNLIFLSHKTCARFGKHWDKPCFLITLTDNKQ